MRIDPLAMTRLTVKPSRRGVLRAAGRSPRRRAERAPRVTGGCASVVPDPHPRTARGAGQLERLRFFSMVKRSSTSSITARPVIGSKWIQEWCGPRFAATGLGSTTSSSIPSPRWSRMKTTTDPLRSAGDPGRGGSLASRGRLRAGASHPRRRYSRRRYRRQGRRRDRGRSAVR